MTLPPLLDGGSSVIAQIKNIMWCALLNLLDPGSKFSVKLCRRLGDAAVGSFSPGENSQKGEAIKSPTMQSTSTAATTAQPPAARAAISSWAAAMAALIAVWLVFAASLAAVAPALAVARAAFTARCGAFAAA